mmetsp:Transcript_14569/g.34546  ORF Transcript_14569/g.34546 Transcript_14569/m.34546 type:complete len:423 (-) Transcript_14569:93-1361(-)
MSKWERVSGIVFLFVILACGGAIPHRHRERASSLERKHSLSDVEIDEECLKPISTPLPTDRPLSVSYTVTPLLVLPEYGNSLDVIASLTLPSPKHICAAHRAGVRILSPAEYVDKGDPDPNHNYRGMMNNYWNTTALAEWQSKLETYVKQTGVDGFAHDLEDEFQRGSPMYTGYPIVVQYSNQAVENAVPTGLVVVAVGWSPDAIDGRLYDYLALSRHGFLYVMAYDMASQLWTRCMASSNAPFYSVKHGLNRYLDVGVAREKLVLATGWYGRSYLCSNESPTLDIAFCSYEEKPFRGAPCSDIGARFHSIWETERMVHGQQKELMSAPQWDTTAGTFFINVLWPVNATSGQMGVYQLWYPDLRSLEMQYQMAIEELQIGGLGMWTMTDLSWVTDFDKGRSQAVLTLLGKYAGPPSPPWPRR